VALDPTVEADILDWIGAAEDGEDIDATYALRGTVEATALSILRRRRATLGPDAWTLSGDYSENDNGRTAAWLDAQIARLSTLCGAPLDEVTVGTVHRCQPTR
jgi:hypothetical protein